MLTFIAGARINGLTQASAVAVSASSARPWASLARTFAVQGAMTSASQRSAIEMWSGIHSPTSSKSPVQTGLRERVRKVSGVTNRAAAAVMTTETSYPSLEKRRTSSQAL